jgi:hydroxymethylbilane synthase
MLTIGTRRSPLAMWQANHVAALLQAAWPTLEVHLEPFTTQGDLSQAAGTPLPSIGGKGLFTAELEQAIRDGRIQLAVHSLKDLPVADADGLTIGAIPARAEVRDVLVAHSGHTLATLPEGARVGTSSPRRAAQLAAVRPDLRFEPIRGNVETRLRKVLDERLYDATVLAAAGLERLGLADYASQYLPLEIMLPAPGQGALAIQCATADATTRAWLAPLDDPSTRRAVTAERAFLHALGGGCAMPVGAYAVGEERREKREEGEMVIQLRGVLATADGHLHYTAATGTDPHEVGQRAAALTTRH